MRVSQLWLTSIFSLRFKRLFVKEKGSDIVAIVREKRVRYALKQEQKELESLKKKMEIQQKKEDFGESWKYQLSKVQREYLQDVVGDVDRLKLKDSIDINVFFDPVKFYTDDNDVRKYFDYKKYSETEEAYAPALQEVEDELNGTVQKDSIENMLEEGSKVSSDEEEKIIKVPKFLQKKYAMWNKYFNRFIPFYNRYVCTCCGKPLEIDDYFPQYIETNLARLETNGKMHMSVCIECCKKIYEYLFYEKAEKDPVEAMKWFCSYLNVYFDEYVYYQARDAMIQNSRKNHIVYEYMAIINRTENYKNKCFMDSKMSFGKASNEIIEQDEPKKRGRPKKNQEEIQVGLNSGQLEALRKENILEEDNGELMNVSSWSKEDLQNRKLVIKMVGYDPFGYESEENQKMLYADLLGMLDQGMEQDEVKLQAAIQIVTSFLRVRELNKTYREKEKENASVNELKAISDLKAKELKTITDFSRDNGFSERYTVAKAKGENSFTGIMNKMDERKYENALVNRYNIETSATIQQAADASFKAIIGQLSLSDAEVWMTCKAQLEELQKLRRENATLTENLRKAKYELAKVNLEEEAKKRGIEDTEDDFGGF